MSIPAELDFSNRKCKVERLLLLLLLVYDSHKLQTLLFISKNSDIHSPIHRPIHWPIHRPIHRHIHRHIHSPIHYENAARVGSGASVAGLPAALARGAAKFGRVIFALPVGRFLCGLDFQAEFKPHKSCNTTLRRRRRPRQSPGMEGTTADRRPRCGSPHSPGCPRLAVRHSRGADSPCS